MNYNYRNLPPFKWFILQNFPFIEDDFDAITNYQMFCKLGEEINKVIESVNLTGEQVENLTNAYNDLKDYIDNYFENLDVQDEIDNKLDEMAEQGQLAEIISQYLQTNAIFGFNTISEMAEAENVINGTLVYCYGKSTYNDGEGAFYKIRTVTSGDVVDGFNIVAITNDNTLIAERIPTNIESEVNIIKNNVSSHRTTSSRVLRKLYENHSNNYYASASTMYCRPQGFCIIDDNTLAVGLIPDDNTITTAKIQFINRQNGNVIREFTGDFGHVNDLSYNPDDDLLYIAGCSVYDNNNQLVESAKLVVVNYENLTYNEYTLPNVIQAVSYDRDSKRLFVSYFPYVYELSKDNYSIINTITLTPNYAMGEGTVGQTLKYHNNKFYRTTSFPNVIRIYDYEGNNVNCIVLDEYADNSYFIGEIETIDFYKGLMYFNSNVQVNKSNYNIVQFFKTSLEYNITNLNAFGTNAEGGQIRVYVDNTATGINPNGEVTNPFSNLAEAVLTLNSPMYSRFSSQAIELVSTSNIYYGCQINCSNLRIIYTNNQTIGTTEILGIPELYINRCTFSATIENQPVLLTINSTVNMYRPSFRDTDSISNGEGLAVNNCEITLSNKQADDDFYNDLLVNIYNGSSKLHNMTYGLSNIKKGGKAVIVDMMKLYSGTINQDGTYSYTNLLTPNITSEMANYRYINFRINGVNKFEIIKLQYYGGDNRVNAWRMYNSTSDKNIAFAQYTVTFNSSNITVTNSKIVAQNQGTSTITTTGLEINITDIYLSDN